MKIFSELALLYSKSLLSSASIHAVPHFCLDNSFIFSNCILFYYSSITAFFPLSFACLAFVSLLRCFNCPAFFNKSVLLLLCLYVLKHFFTCQNWKFPNATLVEPSAPMCWVNTFFQSIFLSVSWRIASSKQEIRKQKGGGINTYCIFPVLLENAYF